MFNQIPTAMKNQISFFFLSAILMFSIVASGTGNDLYGNAPKKGKKEAIVKLFNGKDLDGWYTYIKDKGRDVDPKKVFTVQKGEIRISGEEFGCITTNEEFENYRIVVEFRWGEMTFSPRTDKARDSGLLLHSVGEDGGSDKTWMHSIECQIIEGGTGDFIVVGDGSKNYSITSHVAAEKQGESYKFNPEGQPVTVNSGRINWLNRDPAWKDVKGFRGVNDAANPVGKWNKLECIAKNGEISVYLNGTLVNQAFDVKPSRGKIQIQSEGAEIFVRKVELTKLD